MLSMDCWENPANPINVSSQNISWYFIIILLGRSLINSGKGVFVVLVLSEEVHSLVKWRCLFTQWMFLREWGKSSCRVEPYPSPQTENCVTLHTTCKVLFLLPVPQSQWESKKSSENLFYFIYSRFYIQIKLSRWHGCSVYSPKKT